MNKPIFTLLVVASIMTGCESTSKPIEQTTTQRQFKLPEIPAIIQSPEQQANYMVVHYWDNFEFADTTLISKPEITEQIFTNYINLLANGPSTEVVAKGITLMLNKAVNANQAMFDHFVELYEKYLYDPNSPFRKEDHYIEVLRSIVGNNQLDDIYKVRPRHQLEMALKNRPGNPATNFEFTLKDNKVMKLSNVSSQYTILFFNNPDCPDCARVKKVLTTLDNPNVKIVAIYSDEEVELWKKTAYPTEWINGHTLKVRDENMYDLRAIPTLYLLDKDKKVILKDAPVEIIIEWLAKQQ